MSAEGDLILNQLVGAVRGGMPTKSVMYVTRAPVSLTRIKLVLFGLTIEEARQVRIVSDAGRVP